MAAKADALDSPPDMTTSAPVAQTPTPRADAIAQTLIRDILRGRYAMGDRIREQEVADRLNASRGPVREALQIVEQEGLVENLPFRGARVVNLTVNDIEDLFHLTAALMAVAARLAAQRASDEELQEFARRVEDHAASADPARPFSAQLSEAFALGSYMFRLARSPYVAATQGRVVRLVYWQHRVLNTVDPAWRRKAVDTWRDLAAALQTRDQDKAERAVNRVDKHARDRVLRMHRQLAAWPLPDFATRPSRPAR